MIAQLWNSNTPVIVSCDADQTEKYMYISMKFRTGVHVFCWEVGVFDHSSFQSVSYNYCPKLVHYRCIIERFDGVSVLLFSSLLLFYRYRKLCQETGKDIFPFSPYGILSTGFFLQNTHGQANS